MAAGDHQRLLEIIRGLQCHVAISSYANELYRSALAGWQRARRRVRTRWGGWRTEILYYNFEQVTSAGGLYRGADFRERWRVQKRLRRWRNKFAQLPDWERRILLAELVKLEQTAGPTAANGAGAGGIATSDAGIPHEQFAAQARLF